MDLYMIKSAVQCRLALYLPEGMMPVLWAAAAAVLFLCGLIVFAVIASKRSEKIRQQQETIEKVEREYAELKADMEKQTSGSEQTISQAKTALTSMKELLDERSGTITDLEERYRQCQGQLLSAQTELMKAVEQRDFAKKEALVLRQQIEENTIDTDALLERLTDAEERAERCDHFIRAFGSDAEAFFSRPDAEPRLRRMAAEYLTMVYDASASYLEEKPRPALAEARRIRELKNETQEWIDRALRAEYDLAQRPLQISEQLYLFADPEQEEE